MKVMIVEDEYYSRKYLCKLLGQMHSDIEVIGAYETGRAAVASANLEHADIVVTDIRMPEMDGLELAKHIHQKYTRIRILIVTGYADFSYAQQAIRYNVKNYLTKPIKDVELIDAINSIINELDEQKENIKQQVEEQIAESALQHFTVKEILNNSQFRNSLLGDINDKLEQSNWIMMLIQEESQNENRQLLGELKTLFKSGYSSKVLYFSFHREYIVFLFEENIDLKRRDYTEVVNNWIKKKDMRILN